MSNLLDNMTSDERDEIHRRYETNQLLTNTHLHEMRGDQGASGLLQKQQGHWRKPTVQGMHQGRVAQEEAQRHAARLVVLN